MTMGPAPMIRMEEMSVRRGIMLETLSQSPHHPHKLFEQIEAVLRAGAGLGMILNTERRTVGKLDPAIRSVEQRHMGLAHILRKASPLDRKPVVHAGDL